MRSSPVLLTLAVYGSAACCVLLIAAWAISIANPTCWVWPSTQLMILPADPTSTPNELHLGHGAITFIDDSPIEESPVESWASHLDGQARGPWARLGLILPRFEIPGQTLISGLTVPIWCALMPALLISALLIWLRRDCARSERSRAVLFGMGAPRRLVRTARLLVCWPILVGTTLISAGSGSLWVANYCLSESHRIYLGTYLNTACSKNGVYVHLHENRSTDNRLCLETYGNQLQITLVIRLNASDFPRTFSIHIWPVKLDQQSRVVEGVRYLPSTGTQIPRELVRTISAPLWFIVLVAAAYPVVVFLNGPVRRWRRLRRGRCIVCAYNLTGNTTGKCPECGTAILTECQPRLARDPQAQI